MVQEEVVNHLLEDNIPKAVTTKMLQQETSSDEELQQLTKFIQSQDKDGCKKNLKEYSGVFDELYTINGIILRDQQIVIPKSLRADVIELAHEGHQGIDKTLKLLRQSSWFPKMGDLVKQFVESCIPCLASNPHITPVPLEPNVLPDQPWQKVHADFKGPIGGGQYYLHIVIDQFSKYPEVDIVTSTSFKKLKPIMDRIFATHGIPEDVTADNGPPYPSDDMKNYAAGEGIQSYTCISRRSKQ